MGLDDPAAIDAEGRLFDMGMDSIMAVSLADALEAELGAALSTTLVFNHPTARAIVTFLLGEVLTFDAQGIRAPLLEPGTTAGEGIDSDADLLREARRIEEKLAQINKWIDS
jgi:acyl carrier protein